MQQHLPALTDLGLAGYEVLAELPGARRHTPGMVRRWVLQRGARDLQAMTDLPAPLRQALAERWRVRRCELDRVHESRDGTLGLLLRLDDGQLIESVSIPEGARRTLCISSQVGCAVGCRFCASGLGGVVRNLSVGEIVEQVLLARELRPSEPLTNYVFMGSGEPTHNLKAVLAAIEVMNHPDGLGIGARRITVSTVGHPEAIRRLAELPIAFNLALSMHMPTDAARVELMPGLGASDLAATLAAAGQRFAATGRRLTVEVVVLAGINDRPEDARRFAELLAGHSAAVNLIPWNPVDGMDYRAPDQAQLEALARTLKQAGIACTIRRPRGRDVGVACGQLRRRAQAG
ncbi:MAG: 23S rRNA (adenine(2503)-C(2))-methyltransferase RlmN [Planctomycetota bacterium]